MRTIFFHTSLAVFVIFSVAAAGTTGKLAGRIIDRQTGEPVIGASVVLASTTMGASTDVDGYYHIINIPPGTYDVAVSCVGYARLATRATIRVDLTTTLDIALVPQAVEMGDVVVQAERMVIQRDQSSTMQRTNADELAVLPVNTISGVLQLQTGVVNTGALHIRGGRAGEVGYYLDGYRVEDPLFNGSVMEVNNQAIQEMELLSGTFNAEYGNALSGIVNIVTKENMSRLRANLSYKRTNIGLEDASDNLNERYFEGTVSGPLWAGSPIGFLVSGKKVDAESYYFSGLTDTTGGTRRSVEFSKDKPYGFNDLLTLVGKVTWSPFGSAKITLLDNYSKRKSRSYNHVMRFIPDSTYLTTSESNLVGLNFRHAVTADLFYEIRLSAYQYSYLRSVDGRSPAEYTRALFTTFTNSLFYQNMSQSVYEDQTTKSYAMKADMTWQMDRINLVKAGLELKSNDLDYFYNSNPVNPTDQIVNVYRKKPLEGSGYIQDKIEFETIVLNLGLRYDFFDAATTYPQDPINPNDPQRTPFETKIQSTLSPRLGIAYPVRDNMVFHFTYGQFFQRPEYQVLYNNLERAFANRGTTLFGSPALKPEKTSSYELGVMTTIGAHSSVQTTFFSKKIENLTGVAWNYTPLAYAYYVNEDFASVKGFEVSTKTRLEDISFAVNYTYSIAKGSSSSQQERYTNVYNIVGVQSLRFLPLDFDQRHTGNAQISVDFGKNEGPFGLLGSVFENSTATLLARYGSGIPYTFNPARAIYVAEQNNSRLPAIFTVDLFARKAFFMGPVELGLFLDIRNLMDRKNIVSVYSATGLPDRSGDESTRATPDYQQDPTNYSAPRTIYVGVDVEF
ncbi:MAG: TonB-dependent receptor [Bacteroidetes bacterium]|jgi:hypothetical protein|nr:TonB-dependent receptor [Bacteroidota bacterium]